MLRNHFVLLVIGALLSLPSFAQQEICVGADGVKEPNSLVQLQPLPTTLNGISKTPFSSFLEKQKYNDCMKRLSSKFLCSRELESNAPKLEVKKTPSLNFASGFNQDIKRCGYGYKLTTQDYLLSKCYAKNGAWVGSNDPACGNSLKNGPGNFDYKAQMLGKIEANANSECKIKSSLTQGMTKEDCAKAGGAYTSKEDVLKREKDSFELEGKRISQRALLTDTQSHLKAQKEDKHLTLEAKKLAHQTNLTDLNLAQDEYNKSKETLKDTKRDLHKKENQLWALTEKKKIDGQLSADDQEKFDKLTGQVDQLKTEIGDENSGLIKKVADNKAKVTNEKEEVAKSGKELDSAQGDSDQADDAYADSFGGSDDIQQKNESESYGGRYGGANVRASEAVSNAVQQVSATTEMAGGQKVQMAAQDREAALRQQGTMNLNTEQLNEARRSVAEDAKSSLISAGVIDMAMGLYQGVRAIQHLKSKSAVDGTASKAETMLLKAGDAQSTETSLIIAENQRGENRAQDEAAAAQTLAASAMLIKGGVKLQQAKTISAIEAQANASAHQYGFGMGGGIIQGGGQDGMNTLSPVQSAVTTEEERKKEELAQNNNINPNDPNLVPEGPPVAAFENRDPGAGGGGAGGGPGMAGGTSADKSAMEAGAQGPAAVTKAGSYAPVAGGGGYKSRSAGAAKAGVDTGFADLLKKFLPGSEPEKKKAPGELQFGDRSPASSQTAVIGRNKNIFEEISKRYQKKSAEGSVF